MVEKPPPFKNISAVITYLKRRRMYLCGESNCYRIVMTGLDECKTHCYHISWRALGFNDFDGENWKRRCMDCGLYSILGFVAEVDWVEDPDLILCPHEEIRTDLLEPCCSLCGFVMENLPLTKSAIRFLELPDLRQGLAKEWIEKRRKQACLCKFCERLKAAQ